MSRPPPLWRQPLVRLLAVNLMAGASVALLMLAGLLALNPGNLRTLLFADGGTALALLLFGLVVTFGSAAMGSAIMALGQRGGGEPRGRREAHPLVPAQAATKAQSPFARP
jgi:hypothetical protein